MEDSRYGATEIGFRPDDARPELSRLAPDALFRCPDQTVQLADHAEKLRRAFEDGDSAAFDGNAERADRSMTRLMSFSAVDCTNVSSAVHGVRQLQRAGLVKRDVLTGAPASGKTSIPMMLRARVWAVIEEAATDVSAGEQARGVAEPCRAPSS